MVKSFPGITTKETSVVPPLKPKDWRETLGIVAKFRKGPPIARVRSLEDLANYFGDDNHEGALTIHTAMDNSTRDFVVSRPIPSNTSAYVSFDLETRGTPQQSYVDDAGDVPTHGISLLSEYVSDVAYLTPCSSRVRSIKKHLNSDLAGVTNGEFGNPDFQSYLDGQGTLNFRSELYLEGGITPASPRQVLDSVRLFNLEVNGSRIYSGDSLSGFEEEDSIAAIVEIGSLEGFVIGTNPFDDFIKGHIIPGARLELTAAPASLNNEAVVLSPPEEYYNADEDYTAYRFAVRLTFAEDNPEIGTGEWIELIDVDTPTLGEIRFPDESMYIFSYNWNPLTPNASPKASQGEYITGMFPSYIEDSFVDGYVIFNQESGIKQAELYNFFLEWNRDLAIQLAPVNPVNIVDFDINSVAELSSSTIGFSPAKLKMLDEGDTLFDVVLDEDSPNVQGEGSLTLRSEPYFRGAPLPQNPISELNTLRMYNPGASGDKLYENLDLANGSSFVAIVEFDDLVNYTFGTNEFDEFVKDNILPGVEISLTGTSAPTNPITGIVGTAEVLSPPEKYYNTTDEVEKYRFAIKLTTNADPNITLGTGDWIQLMDQETPTPGNITFPTPRHVFSYTWAPITENAAPNVVGGGNHITNMFPSYTSSSWVDGYVIFDSDDGVQTVELFNFFNFWNKDDYIQISPTTPLDLIQLDTANLDDINSYGDISYATLTFNASNVEMLSGTGLVYNDFLSNVNTPSTFAVRIDHAMASVGRPFTDQNYDIPPLEVGTPFAEVIDSLFSQLNEMDDSSEIFSDFSKDSAYDRMSMNTVLSSRLETRAEGLTANNMTIRVCLTGDGPANIPPSDVVNDGWTTVFSANLVKTVNNRHSNFELAKQGAAPASRIFYTDTGEPLLRVVAVSPGETDLEITIKPRRSGQFDMIIVDRDSEQYYDAPLVERIQLTNKGANQNGTGLYPGSQNSKLINAYYLPRRYGLAREYRQEFETKNPARIGANLGTFVPDANQFNDFEGTPSVSTVAVGETYLTDVKLLGGTDGTDGNKPSDEDYLEAVKRLEGFDIVALTCPDIKFNGNPEQPVIAEMIRQAEESDPFNGLRQAIFQLPRKLPVTRVKSIVPQRLNSERVILVAGYTTYDQKPEVGVNRVPILGTYLGWTYSRPPSVSPAAISQSEVIKAATTTTIPADEGYLSALSENGVEGIYFDKSVQRLRFANGQTTSTDVEGQYASVVRTYDQVTMDLAQRLSFVRSQPLSKNLMRRVAGICDTRLEYLKSKGWIAGYQPTIVDERNNTDADLRQGKLNVDLNIDAFVPADHIILNFLRQRTKTLTLQTDS